MEVNDLPTIKILEHDTTSRIAVVYPIFHEGQKLDSKCNYYNYLYEYLICKIYPAYYSVYPACYIRIPNYSIFKNTLNCKIKQPEYFDKYASVHGGFTYLNKECPPVISKEMRRGIWIGWDYATDDEDHDYSKYSVEELKNDVMCAINQLFESERRLLEND